ncbi:MAG: PAC2 family protein [Candidatus Nitrosopelagicus sp.]|nr:PAC2 family protein [Candidatus Nitrosopelagicus sp.]HIA97123.1 proteasome assembly chaperone family protein [Candidatus Nitrosopelagicus sp.]HIO85633.1 proteasome assembly chaperone family protein [Candidatus Nitrosopelagicus sp.]
MVGKSFSDNQVYEIKKTVLKSPIIFAGFVGAGLVGPLSIGYMIEKLKMKEIAYLRSRHLPPSTVFMQGRLRHPFRLYSNNDGTICAVICEITLPFGLHDIVNTILDWAEKNGSHEIVILDGVASKTHDGKAFCAAEEDLCRVMESNDINMIPQGFITGVAGGLLNECLMRPIQGITLLVKANDKGADPLAAATLLDAVNRAYGLNINTSDLRKKKKRIGEDFRELSDKYTEHRKIDSNMYM